jgi:hypothetical protein
MAADSVMMVPSARVYREKFCSVVVAFFEIEKMGLVLGTDFLQ